MYKFNRNENILVKVYMTQKIFSAYLKSLSKYRRMAFFFEISFFVLEILTFIYYANQTCDAVILLQLKSGKN